MKYLILAITLLCSSAFAQNIAFENKEFFYDVKTFILILFYLNILFILIITCLAQRGRKLLIFLTMMLENVFILIIGLNFGLERLSIILFLINPLLLVSIIFYMIKNRGKFI